jgi:acetyltransferase-like isoleucine patch superfamily enzyme
MTDLTSQHLPQYNIGRWTYGSPEVLSWGEGATLEIGNFSSIAAGVKIFLGGEHRTDWVTTYPFSVLWSRAKHIAGHPYTKGDVRIGSDVWLGADSVILSGVTIGDGAVVGARSVVPQDVPPFAVVFGNPAKLLRYRFGQETIRALLEIAWWRWSDDKIADFLPYLLSQNIRDFIARATESAR